MKKRILVLLMISVLLFSTSCQRGKSETEHETQAPETKAPETETEQVIYENITAEEAKKIMDSETGYVILDVRTEEEFAEGHIKGAILIPDYEIAARAEGILLDKNQKILVYCRSGRRSKLTAEALLALGYTNVWEFGGIIDWPYEIEK